MGIKTILVAASGGTATGGAIDLACQLAQRFRAHLEGYHARLDIPGAAAALGEGAALGPTVMIVESMLAEGKATASEARSLFATILAHHKIALDEWPCPIHGRASASWREETGYAPELVARRARFFDLAVLGRSGRAVGEHDSETIEEVLAGSGRPVLLAPANLGASVASTVAIAWNGSPEAVRALTASLPFLSGAEAVWLISSQVGDPDSTASAMEYLARHGFGAAHCDLPDRPGRHIGSLLLDAARSCDADLLVMGGYGRAPWRETVFGGATPEALRETAMPLLLMH
jgi:nucleotide-binding universal stress UspA family protein